MVLVDIDISVLTVEDIAHLYYICPCLTVRRIFGYVNPYGVCSPYLLCRKPFGYVTYFIVGIVKVYITCNGLILCRYIMFNRINPIHFLFQYELNCRNIVSRAKRTICHNSVIGCVLFAGKPYNIVSATVTA